MMEIKSFLLNNLSIVAEFSLTIIISVLLIRSVIKNNEKIFKILGIISTIIVSSLPLVSAISNSRYTVVPSIRNLSTEFAIHDLNEASLDYDMDDFIDSENKIVNSVEPEEGSRVKRHTKVKVTMSIPNTLEHEKTISENDYFTRKNNYILYSLEPFNTNKLELHLSDIGVLLHTENEEYSREIGQKKITNAKVSLINIYNDKTIVEKISDKEGKVVFENIPDGTYIYRIERDGYETLVSEVPFKLAYDNTKEESVLVWGISIKNDSNVFNSPKFRIKIVDNNGNVIKRKEFDVRPIKEAQRSSFSSIPVYTDENGYICLWHSERINNEPEADYYDVVDFELEQEYQLDIVDSYGDYKTIDGSRGKSEYIICFN